ncbi:MAG TPA: hypothetical protein VNO50_16955 [Pyrinomonadaceae bacterium]|nr:hypothetical protein [Pyrinomonadaceae bacterium]
MKNKKSGTQELVAQFLLYTLVLNSLIGLMGGLLPVSAQKKRLIVVNADQPNLWTLEQAHYLLAQMHRRNLDLKAKSLEELDPNEIAGLRFDVMRMLVEFGATFNQADLVSNRLLSANQSFNSERRQQLLTERDGLRRESVNLAGDIEGLETEKAGTEDKDAQKTLDAKIAAKTNRLARVDKEIETLNGELTTLNAPSGQPTATSGGATFDPSKLPKSEFDEAFKAAAAKQIEKFNQSPQLNASLKLDNFLQMQYEIISKQLSLLRDEVGPGERLVFLELPQTVNAAHHESKRKWAQSWWKIAGYTRRELSGEALAMAAPGPSPQPHENTQPITTLDDVNSILEGKKIDVRLKPTSNLRPCSEPSELNCTPKILQAKYEDKFYPLKEENVVPAGTALNDYLDRAKNPSSPRLDNRSVRTVELIPRQSSLNVNDMNLKVKAGALNFVFSTLFGFGSQLKAQRQREQFSQFVQQELYSAAFGKGAREFGWTFTPMPGTDRLHSGVRTTYAVVVVPEVATSLVLESTGCYFPRSSYQPNDFADTLADDWNAANRTSRNCSGPTARAFVVPIPAARLNGGNEFWVDRIQFQNVAKGKRIVVSISGKNFSPQIGALINGVPLVHSIGLAQPLIRDDSATGRATADDLKAAEIVGYLERIDSNKVLLSFKMPSDFQGTPTITLIAPGRATDINSLPNVEVNEVPGTKLADYPKKMFGHGPGPDPFRIDKVRVFRSRPAGKLTAEVSGAGFGSRAADVPTVFVNGTEETATTWVSPTRLTVKFPIIADETIRVTLVSTNLQKQTAESDSIANPVFLSIADVEVVSYELATEDEPNATLVVKITGSGFSDNLSASVGGKALEVAVKSATEAVLTIPDPKAASIVTLEDTVTKQKVKVVVARKFKAK